MFIKNKCCWLGALKTLSRPCLLYCLFTVFIPDETQSEDANLTVMSLILAEWVLYTVNHRCVIENRFYTLMVKKLLFCFNRLPKSPIFKKKTVPKYWYIV